MAGFAGGADLSVAIFMWSIPAIVSAGFAPGLAGFVPGAGFPIGIFEWSIPALASAGFAPGLAGFAPGAGVPMTIFEWSIPAIASAGGVAAGVVGTAARQVKSWACAAPTARCRSANLSAIPLALDALSNLVLAASTIASAFRPAFAQAGLEAADAVIPAI